MTSYLSSSDIKEQLTETLGSSTDTSYDSLIDVLISSASRAIDGYLGQEDDYFYPSSDTEARYYDGNGKLEMKIDDFISISEIAVSEAGGVSSSDYTAWSSSDYIIAPYNASTKGKPYNTIIIDVINSGGKAFYRFKKSVKVTGIFGYSTTPPADVKQACNIMVIRYFMRAKNAFQDAGANPAIGQMFYVRELDPDVKLLLNKYVLESL